MRSAKFGQGTNSNFMPTPLWAVKSFDSSTSAFAGSQAAQHRVIVFDWARTGVAGTIVTAAASATAPANSFFIGRSLRLLSSRPDRCPAGGFSHSRDSRASADDIV